MTAVVAPVAAAAEPTGQAAAVPAAAAPVAAVAPVPPVAAVPAAPVVPETYTLTLPEKHVLEPKFVDRLTPVLKDLGVTDHAKAQKVVDAVMAEGSEVIRVYEAARAPGGELHKAVVAGFTADAKADPFLGNGDDAALVALSTKAGQMLAHYGPEYAARLNENGDAVHPSFLRFMKRLAADFGEKALAQGGATLLPAPESLAKRFAGDVDKHLAAAGIIPQP